MGSRATEKKRNKADDDDDDDEENAYIVKDFSSIVPGNGSNVKFDTQLCIHSQNFQRMPSVTLLVLLLSNYTRLSNVISVFTDLNMYLSTIEMTTVQIPELVLP